MKIAMATPSDWEILGGLLIDMHAEVGIGKLDVAKMQQGMGEVLQTGACLLAISDEGEAVGTMGLMVSAWWYSQDQYMGDMWFYVRPDGRKSRAAPMLLKAAKGLADAASLKLHLAAFGPDLDRKREFYRRAGFVEIGAYFVAKD